MSIDNVEDLPARVQYVAAAAQTDFDYPFPIFTNADLIVDVDGVTKVLTTNYTMTGAGNDTGGTVTFGTPMSGGEIVTLYRQIAIERLTDIQQNGPWSSTAYNDEQDKTYLLLQQLDERCDRSLRLPIIAEVDGADLELAPANYANKYLTFDADGKPTPALLSDSTMTQSTIGQLLYPRTADEIAAAVIPTNYYYAPGNVLRYGAAADGSTDDTQAFIDAHASLPSAGGKIIAPKGSYLISSEVEFTKRTILEGEGFSNATGILGATTLIKKNTATGNTLKLSATGCIVRDLTVQGQSGNSGDGIQIAAGRCSIQNVGVFLMGNDGIRVGSDTGSLNCNLWSLYNVHCSSNTEYGINVSSNVYPTAPDANGGTLCHANCASNGSAGVYIGNAWLNYFFGLTVQGNTTYGVQLGAHAKLNCFYGGDWDEGNGSFDLRLETGAVRNYFNGMALNFARISAGVLNDNIYFIADYDTNVGTHISHFIRDGANYFLCSETNGFMQFVTGGLSGSTANSSLVLAADGTFILGRGSDPLTNVYKGTVTWNPALIADGAVTNTTVTVTGASIGDQVIVGFSNAVPANSFMVGSVTATDTVTVTLFNKTGSNLDLASGTLRVTVVKQ